MLATADAVAAMGIDGIKLHLLYVVRGTRLAQRYHDGTYRCLEQSEYADLVCEFIARLPPRMIIHRLTGDPHPKELVAPVWSLQKKETLEMIHRRFPEKNTWQGKYLKSNIPDK
jgi:radical SAM superfamily enzyme